MNFNSNLCFLDIETTGFSPLNSEIIEVYIESPTGEVFESLFKPIRPIPKKITDLTGISNDLVKYQPRLEEKIDEISNILENKIIVAHNATFDLSFLQFSIARFGLKVFPIKYFCTLSAAKRLFNLDSFKLTNLAKSLGFKSSLAHRAKSDCSALKYIFQKIELKLLHAKENPENYLIENGFIRIFDKFGPSTEFQFPKIFSCTETLIEFIYDGGSLPGEKRKAVLNSFYEMSGQNYLSAFCTKDRIEKSFRLDRISGFVLNLANEKKFCLPTKIKSIDPERILNKLDISYRKNSPSKKEGSGKSSTAQKNVTCIKCGIRSKVKSSFKSIDYKCPTCGTVNLFIEVQGVTLEIESSSHQNQIENLIYQLVERTNGKIDSEILDSFFDNKQIAALIISLKLHKVEIVEKFEHALKQYVERGNQEVSKIFSCESCHKKLRLKSPIKKGTYECPFCKFEFKAFELGGEIVVL
jgi:DNA polymerase III epsilon subunit-like protein/predicted RNA-binding Zn-ribbon protein involved in translation (DUF1610 family)